MDLSTKKCNKCCLTKSLTDFSKKKNRFQHLCKLCQSEYNKSYRIKNCETLKVKQRETYEASKGLEENPIKLWKHSNKDKISTYNKKYREKYPYKFAKYRAVVKKQRRQSVPKWLSKEQKESIENFYWLARDISLISGERHEVDHILPIRGKNVCGLHVPWNLQILPKQLNLIKSNKIGYPT